MIGACLYLFNSARSALEKIGSSDGENKWRFIPQRQDDCVDHRNPLPMLPFNSTAAKDRDLDADHVKRKKSTVTSHPTRAPDFFPFRAHRPEEGSEIKISQRSRDLYAALVKRVREDNGGRNPAFADDWPALPQSVNTSEMHMIQRNYLNGQQGRDAYEEFMKLE